MERRCSTERETGLIGRRGFLAGAAGLLAATGTAAGSAAGRGVKFCLFADLHYWPGIFPNDTTEFLDRILKRAEDNKVDFVLHLGDLVHFPMQLKGFVDRYNDFHIPTYHTVGNHEFESSVEDVLKAYRLERAYYSFDRGGFRFVITDPNYILRADGKVEHFASYNAYRLGKGDKLAYLPPEQLAWMEDRLEKSPYPCVIASHQSYELDFGTANAAEVRAVIDRVNRRHPGRVRLVMNGHDHIDNLRILEGVVYFNVNSANYQYFDRTHDKYPADYTAKHKDQHCLAWKDPLSAIVTLTPEGGIRIEGARSEWLFGVTPEKAGLNPYDTFWRKNVPVIQSADLTVRT